MCLSAGRRLLTKAITPPRPGNQPLSPVMGLPLTKEQNMQNKRINGGLGTERHARPHQRKPLRSRLSKAALPGRAGREANRTPRASEARLDHHAGTIDSMMGLSFVSDPDARAKPGFLPDRIGGRPHRRRQFLPGHVRRFTRHEAIY